MSKYKLKYVNNNRFDKEKASQYLAVAGSVVIMGSILGTFLPIKLMEQDHKLHPPKKSNGLSFEELTDCSLLELQIGIKKDLYLCKKEKKIDKGTLIYSYTTLNDNTNIYNEEAIGGKKYDTLDVIELIKKSDNIEDYLVNFNYVREWYTPKDVNDIMSKIYQVYSYSYNKVKYKVK